MTDFGYCHARIRGMKSRLLDADFFDRLLAAREASEIASLLGETSYSGDIHHGLLGQPGAGGIEEGLRLNLAATFSRILSFVDGEARRLIEVLLERWDVQNIKTILRGKHVGAAPGEIIGSLVPAGTIAEGTLVSLAKEPDIKAAIDLMATWGIRHSRPLTRNFSTYVNSHSLAEMEVALDKDYYSGALDAVKGRSFNASLVRDLVRRQIDFSNIMALLRLANEATQEQAAKFFIEGGREIDRDRFDRLSEAGQIENIVDGLTDTTYSDQLVEGLELYKSANSFAAIERLLEEQTVRKTIGLFRSDPLSLAPAIAYLWAKVNEIINIRIVLRAGEAGMPIPAIRETLILTN